MHSTHTPQGWKELQQRHVEVYTNISEAMSKVTIASPHVIHAKDEWIKKRFKKVIPQHRNSNMDRILPSLVCMRTVQDAFHASVSLLSTCATTD